VQIAYRWESAEGSITLALIGAIIAFSVIIFWFYYRLRKLTIALTLLGNLPKPVTAKQDQILYIPETATLQVEGNIFVCFLVMLLILLFIFLVSYVCTLIRQCKRRYNRKIYLALELSNITDTLIIQMLPLLALPSEYVISATEPLTNLTVSGWLVPCWKSIGLPLSFLENHVPRIM
jgi:hypothetical protein